MNEKYLITIDAGTTNTRVTLLDGAHRYVASEKRSVGVRNTAIDGNSSRLRDAVRAGFETVLEKNGLCCHDVACVLASGMITSNVGLVEVPHLTAPVSIDMLASGIETIELPDVCPLPIHFIPGIKNCRDAVDAENFESMDIMRGEETEAVFLIERYHAGTPMLLVLPGSHMKFIEVDADKRIKGCLTSISGELLASVTNDTILADAVGRSFVRRDTYMREMLLTGYESARRVGLARACFSARILNLFAVKEKERIANYILGAVLQGDVFAVKHSSALHTERITEVVVAGKEPLRSAIADILQHDGYFRNITQHTDETEPSLSARGACILADRLGLA